MKPTVSGEHIYLRPLEASDITDRYVSWFRDSELVKFYSSGRHEFTLEFLRDQVETPPEDTFTYGIFLRQGDTCIGNIRVGPIDSKHRISDLVVIVGDPAYRGRGLAVEAIRLGNRVAFEVHDVRKLVGGMFAANEASIRAYTRADWVVEGRLKGHYLVDGKPMDRVLVGCFNPRYFRGQTSSE